MDVYSAIALCFIPLVATFILFRILVDGLTCIKEILACVIGLIALIPISAIQFVAGDFFLLKNDMFFSLLLRAIFLYGIIEEGIKCAVLFLFPTKKIDLRLMFFYSILAGMILGCFESVIYLITSIQRASLKSGEVLLNMIFLRTFTSIVIHCLCSGLLGLFVFAAKRKKFFVKELIFAIMLHALYDFFAIMPDAMSAFSYIIILLLAIECRIAYIKMKNLIPTTGDLL